MPDQPGVTTSYFLQQRPVGTDGPWQRAIGIHASWRDRATADDRLAGAREMRPDREHRLITRTTVVTDTPTEAAAPAGQAALRDRIAEALLQWAERNNDPKYAPIRRPDTVTANAYGRADAVLAVLPTSADWAACDCLAEVHMGVGFYHQPQCATRNGQPADRAAILREATDDLLQVRDSLITDPECTGKFLAGIERAAAELRRLADAVPVSGPGGAADETQQPAPWLSDSARIGRALIWSWSDIGKGAYGKGYRDAQAQVRSLLGEPNSGGAQHPQTLEPSGCVHRGPHPGFTCAEVDASQPYFNVRWDNEQQPTSCSAHPCNEAADELCDNHARIKYHALGEHTFCDPDCTKEA